jgi:hypothetical protein
MKRLWLFAFLICSPLWATNYYVDNTCANNGDGTTTTCGAGGAHGPFNSIANAQSAITGSQPGNSLLLRAGETFREQYTAPAYGTSGGQFTVGTYGIGAAPIITGANILSSWTTVAGGSLPAVSGSWALNEGSGTTAIDTSGNSLTGTWTGTATGTGATYYGAGHNQTYAGKFNGTNDDVGLGSSALLNPIAGASMSVCIWVNTTTAGAQTVFSNYVSATHENGWELATGFNSSNGKPLFRRYTTTGASNEVDATVAVNDGNWHLICGVYDGTNDYIYVDNNAAVSAAYSGTYAPNGYPSADIGNRRDSNQWYTGLAQGAQIYASALTATQVGYIYNGSAGAPTYHATVSTQPTQVSRNGTPLTAVALQSSLATGDWWWDATNSYVWVFDNPAGQTMEADQRQYAIDVNGQNYVTVQNLELEQAQYACLIFQGGSTNFLASGNTVTRCSPNPFVFYYLWGAGIQAHGASNGRITGNKVSNSYNDIVLTSYDPTTPVNTSYIRVDSNVVSSAGCAGIRMDFKAAANNTVEYNFATGNGLLLQGCAGFYTWDTGPGNIIRYNDSVLGYGSVAAYSGGAGYETDELSDSAQLYGNVGAFNAGGCIQFGGSNQLVYNNTCYHNDELGMAYYGELLFFPNASSETIKNNIFVASTGQNLIAGETGAITGHTLDYNLYNGGNSTPFVWGASSYNFANYKTASSQDAHSITTAPTFFNTTAGQLWLTAGSPGIAAGTALGSLYNVGIYTGSSWPNALFLIPNLNNDLGAYPYTGYVIDSVMGSGTMASGTMQ